MRKMPEVANVRVYLAFLIDVKTSKVPRIPARYSSIFDEIFVAVALVSLENVYVKKCRESSNGQSVPSASQ